jgi:hypothetical protein
LVPADSQPPARRDMARPTSVRSRSSIGSWAIGEVAGVVCLRRGIEQERQRAPCASSRCGPRALTVVRLAPREMLVVVAAGHVGENGLGFRVARAVNHCVIPPLARGGGASRRRGASGASDRSLPLCLSTDVRDDRERRQVSQDTDRRSRGCRDPTGRERAAARGINLTSSSRGY